MGTHFQGTPAEIRALDTYVKLMRAARVLGARTDPARLGAPLTGSQFGVLETLLHLGPLSHQALGAKQFRSGSNLTTVVDNLERRRLVRRAPDAADRRRVTVHLTPAGRALVTRVLPWVVAAIVRALGVLTPAEQAALGQLCRKTGRGESPGVDARGALASAGDGGFGGRSPGGSRGRPGRP